MVSLSMAGTKQPHKIIGIVKARREVICGVLFSFRQEPHKPIGLRKIPCPFSSWNPSPALPLTMAQGTAVLSFIETEWYILQTEPLAPWKSHLLSRTKELTNCALEMQFPSFQVKENTLKWSQVPVLFWDNKWLPVISHYSLSQMRASLQGGGGWSHPGPL